MALLKDHLIAHYKMNDNAATAVVVDATGNHNGEYQLNSVAQNTDTGNETGKILGALDFVGGVNGEQVTVPDHDDFISVRSISVWINMHNASNFQIASKGLYNVDAEWQLRVDSAHRLIIRAYDESKENCYIGVKSDATLTVYQNSWIHIVSTYDGGVLSSGFKFCVNGLEIAASADELFAVNFEGIENLNHDVWIGRYSASYANGLIDNLMFFNKELTLNDVRILYNSGRGTENIPIEIQLSRTGHRFSSFPEN